MPSRGVSWPDRCRCNGRSCRETSHIRTDRRVSDRSPTRACRGGTVPHRIAPAFASHHRHTSSDLGTQPCAGTAQAMPAGNAPDGHGRASSQAVSILELLHVREKAAGLHAVDEPAWCTGGPRSKGAPFGKTVKRIVDFDRVEKSRRSARTSSRARSTTDRNHRASVCTPSRNSRCAGASAEGRNDGADALRPADDADTSSTAVRAAEERGLTRTNKPRMNADSRRPTSRG